MFRLDDFRTVDSSKFIEPTIWGDYAVIVLLCAAGVFFLAVLWNWAYPEPDAVPIPRHARQVVHSGRSGRHAHPLTWGTFVHSLPSAPVQGTRKGRHCQD